MIIGEENNMKEITLETVEAVMHQGQTDFESAKKALIEAEGEVEEAVDAIRAQKASQAQAAQQASGDSVSDSQPDADGPDKDDSRDGSAASSGQEKDESSDKDSDSAQADEASDDGESRSRNEKCADDIDAAARKAAKELKENAKDAASDAKRATDEVIAKLKKLVKTGNVDRIIIRHKDEILLNVPMNVGVIGGVIGLAVAPWAMIAATVAAFGFSCRIEVVKKDGTKEEI